MKTMKSAIKLLLTVAVLCITSDLLNAQSLLGTWQLVNESTCLESELESDNDSIEPLAQQMKSMSKPAPQIVTFKEKGAGEESTRILNKKKNANQKNFLYKFDGEMLLILDKRSQTLAESFTVDKLDSDSLIISNSARACETKIFIKIKGGKAN